MKNLLIIALSCALFLSLFAGCAKDVRRYNDPTHPKQSAKFEKERQRHLRAQYGH